MIGPRKKISQILVALVDAVGNLEPRKRKTSKKETFTLDSPKSWKPKQKC